MILDLTAVSIADAQFAPLVPRAIGVAYLIVNTTNNKAYVGITKNPALRLKAHIGASKRGSETPLHRAIRRYGLSAFTIRLLASASSWSNLLKVERFLICQFDSFLYEGHGYNLTRGGEGVLGHRHTVSVRARMAETARRQVVSEETRAKLRGRKPTPETLAKIAAVRSGIPCSEQTKAKIREKLTGRKITSEQRARMLQAIAQPDNLARRKERQLGVKLSDETRAKMAAAKRGGHVPVVTPVGTFPHIVAAAGYFGISASAARLRLRKGYCGWRRGDVPLSLCEAA